MNFDDFDFDYSGEFDADHDDPTTVRAVEKLRHFFEQHQEDVFYETQLCIFFEAEFFHWVTTRALKKMREGREIASELQQSGPNLSLRFYFHRRYRYWKRKATEIRKLVLQFSAQPFTESLGLQGEMMIDAGFPRVGFRPIQANVRNWNDKNWTTSGHDLDRVFERDGLFYGTEIKNRLGYIPQEEFRTKLAMCKELELIPLFVARFMPKTYMNDVYEAGGFCLLMKFQFYPFAHRDLARKVQTTLNLPVDCPARLQDTTLDRLLKWHLKKLKRANPQPNTPYT